MRHLKCASCHLNEDRGELAVFQKNYYYAKCLPNCIVRLADVKNSAFDESTCSLAHVTVIRSALSKKKNRPDVPNKRRGRHVQMCRLT